VVLFVADIERNETEIIRVEKKEFKGKEYIDIRIFYLDSDNEYKPTKKGVTLKPEKIDEMIGVLQSLKE
jgi:hypothetical protein